MANNAKTAVIGIAFAILAIAGYQLVYKQGIWAPNSAMRHTIMDAMGRADRISAQQAKTNLDAMFARAEKGEKLNPVELRKAIEAVAKDAGELEKLYKDAEIVSHGQIVAPPSVTQTQPRPPTQQARSSVNPTPEPSVRTKEQETRVAFFDSVLDVDVMTTLMPQAWTRVKSPPAVHSLDAVVNGEIEMRNPTADQRTRVGPKGVDIFSIPNWSASVADLHSGLVAPEYPYLALLARFCDLEQCSQIQVFQGNPWHFCIPSGKWLEFKANYITTYVLWNPNGNYKVRFRGLSEDCQAPSTVQNPSARVGTPPPDWPGCQ